MPISIIPTGKSWSTLVCTLPLHLEKWLILMAYNSPFPSETMEALRVWLGGQHPGIWGSNWPFQGKHWEMVQGGWGCSEESHRIPCIHGYLWCYKGQRYKIIHGQSSEHVWHLLEAPSWAAIQQELVEEESGDNSICGQASWISCGFKIQEIQCVHKNINCLIGIILHPD